ncbi:imidazolonepropionase [Capsaspora owczarzaki ATCC 30864]|uniref:Probable imidazolonepropionase n=1 Tax=Capsaspora owczarzaki (strain ATCC 30864) TaxID=595528 RepID=A0A0D2WTC3_CAPO3|nr:imidazolonepropionase [Capsaspora owczarzaki ATCC 30864]
MSTSNKTYKLCVHNAAQLVTVCSQGERMKRGKAMDEVAIVENGTVVIGHDGRVAYAGPAADAPATATDADMVVNAAGKCVLPGFVDGHTHPFAMKLAGATYMDIHKMGGGIGFTVQHTRASSEEELQKLLQGRLDRMVRAGTTCVEAKSGYGLETATEMKMLKVLHRASKSHPITICSTYLGAHSVPKGTPVADYTKNIVEEQLPELKRLMDAGEIAPTAIDVFFEKGVFEREDTTRILQAGKQLGLLLNFHGDELNFVGAGELGGELGARAISHLEEVSDAGIAAMAQREVFGTLLPTTAYVLRIKPPPARKLIDGNVPVALGSDFNPNAHCLAMPFVMNLACVTMRMTMNESLVAATINAAGSLGVAQDHGSIEVGKLGNLVLIDAPRWEHVVYELYDPPIETVFIKGQVAHSRA